MRLRARWRRIQRAAHRGRCALRGAGWVRGDVESNPRDVEDAVPYGQLRNVTGSNGRSVRGMVRWYRADALALRASPRGLAALVERGGRLLFIRGKVWLRNVTISTPQHASEASRAEREKPTLGNVGFTDCNNQLHSVGQRPVLTRQRPRSETAVGDEETK